MDKQPEREDIITLHRSPFVEGHAYDSHTLQSISVIAQFLFTLIVGIVAWVFSRGLQESPVWAALWGVYCLWGLLSQIRDWIRSGHRRMELQRQRRRHETDQPWLGDHLWDPGGAHNTAGNSVLRSALTTRIPIMVVGSMLINGLAWFLVTGPMIWPTRIFGILSVFNLVWMALLWFKMFRGLPMGGGRLAYERFPFLTGESFDARFIPPEGLRWSSLMASLCFVVNPKHRERWRHSIRLPAIEVAHQRDGLRISIPIPTDAPSTHISGPTAPRWDLAIVGSTDHGTYLGIFLLPIYRRDFTLDGEKMEIQKPDVNQQIVTSPSPPQDATASPSR